MLNVTVNGSFLSSNIAVFFVFGGFVFQLIRYSRVCSSFGEFFEHGSTQSDADMKSAFLYIGGPSWS